MMTNKECILINGKLADVSELKITTSNRCFRYGDGLFETIRVADGFPLFYRSHHSRLVRGLHTLGMEIPEQFSFLHFKDCLLELIEKSGVKNGGLRVQAYRAGEGTYAPETAQFDWIVEIKEGSDGQFYEFPNLLYEIGLFKGMRKAPSPISFFKSSNAQLYVMAAYDAKRKNLDNLLVQNLSGNVIETIAENLFIFKNGCVTFPPVEDGGIEGVMRSVVKKLLIWNKIDFQERSLSVEEIKDAEELFLTNVNKGILPVSKFEEKEYSNHFTIGLQAKLNERVAAILANRQKH